MAFDIQLLRRLSLGSRPSTANSTSSSSSNNSSTSMESDHTTSSAGVASSRGHSSNPARTTSTTATALMPSVATRNLTPTTATRSRTSNTQSAGAVGKYHAEAMFSDRQEAISPPYGSSGTRTGSRSGEEKGGPSRRGGIETLAGSQPGSPRSLVISPNLEALLEHDERVRRTRLHGGTGVAGPSITSTVGASSVSGCSDSAGSEFHPGVGLPPPPRACPGQEQRPVSRRLNVQTEESFVLIGTANPYINRAPRFDEVGDGDRYRRETSREEMDLGGYVRVEHTGKRKSKEKRKARPSTSNGTERAEQFSNVTRSLALLAAKTKRLPKLPVEMESGAVIGSGHHHHPYGSHASYSSASSSASTSTAYHKPPRINTSIYDNRISPPDRMSSLRNFVGHRSTQSVVDRDSDRASFIDLLSPEPQRADFTQDEPKDLKRGRSRSRSPKPPIPTSPKPIFNRPASPLAIATRMSPKPSPAPSPLDTVRGPPPTTNILSADDRADLVRKAHKLAKMFGKPPGPAARNQTALPAYHRATASVSTTFSSPKAPPVWPPPEGTQYISLSSRRHSNPSTPDSCMSFATNSDLVSLESPMSSNYHDDVIEIGTAEGQTSNDWVESQRTGAIASVTLRADSPTSFIDLSEGEDDTPGRRTPTHHKAKRRGRAPSTSAQSIFENMTPEEQAEEERRRKREKLVKLHRFLGSRVPPNLVLGVPDPVLSLPPVAPTPTENVDDSPESRNAWIRRRRSSSAAAFPVSWSDNQDRLKADLNDREKAINVRRALKMEKVFGVAPPQTLYHTRGQPGPAYGASAAASTFLLKPRGSSLPKSNQVQAGQTQLDLNSVSSEVPTQAQARSLPPSPVQRNKGHSRRPGTTESRKALLGGGFGFSGDHELEDEVETGAGATEQTEQNLGLGPRVRAASFVYTHYQHSLNSLNDIIDRDDKESLAELHEYLHSSEPDLPLPSADILPDGLALTHRASSLSLKSERRRSLPARTSDLNLAEAFVADGHRQRDSVLSLASVDSMASLSSLATIGSLASASSITSFSTVGSGATTPTPGASDFQMRRRRAAKLTAFFGVNYHDLMQDILESIEKGLEDESHRGTLNREEVEELLQKLRMLRTKRGTIF